MEKKGSKMGLWNRHWCHLDLKARTFGYDKANGDSKEFEILMCNAKAGSNSCVFEVQLWIGCTVLPPVC